MPTSPKLSELEAFELQEVAQYAAACARLALAIFESRWAGDGRPQAAIQAAEAFASGARRSKVLRDCAWAALRAAREAAEAGSAAPSEAARAASAAAGAAFLHPVFSRNQVKHILGAAAHSARALELHHGLAADTLHQRVREMASMASPVVVQVLKRYPPAPTGGGMTGELIRQLNGLLRSRQPPLAGLGNSVRAGAFN